MMSAYDAPNSASTHNDECHALVLAAGRGERFDRSGQTHKLLQALPSFPSVLAATLSHTCAAMKNVTVILAPGPHLNALKACCQAFPVNILVCPQISPNMAYSIAYGVLHTPKTKAWLILPGDMPCISKQVWDTQCELIAQGHPIVIPTYQGKRGHPVAFSKICEKELSELFDSAERDEGARRLFDQFLCLEWSSATPAIVMDIDTPAALTEFIKSGLIPTPDEPRKTWI